MTISLEEHVAREPELMPCPFCGGAMLFRAALWPADGDSDGFIHAEPTDCSLGGFSDGSSDRSIIGKWNARASSAASIRESERAACEAIAMLYKEWPVAHVIALKIAARKEPSGRDPEKPS